MDANPSVTEIITNKVHDGTELTLKTMAAVSKDSDFSNSDLSQTLPLREARETLC